VIIESLLDAEFIAKLKKQANRDCWGDDQEFMPNDYSGGNIDDAYYGGCEDGLAFMARDILTHCGIEWKIS